MERVSKLNASQVLRELQTYNQYCNKTQKQIKELVGNKVATLRNELLMLENDKIKVEIKNVKVKEIDDMLYNIYLQLDFDTLINACYNNKSSMNICLLKLFWVNYFANNNLSFDKNKKYSSLDDFINEYIKQSFNKMEQESVIDESNQYNNYKFNYHLPESYFIYSAAIGSAILRRINPKYLAIPKPVIDAVLEDSMGIDTRSKFYTNVFNQLVANQSIIKKGKGYSISDKLKNKVLKSTLAINNYF